MLSRQQQITPPGDDREQIIRARQAAEALFASKPSSVSTRPRSLTPTDESTRRPRVLPTLSSTAPARREERETPAAPEPQTVREVPPAQFKRIRALVKYGMTAIQVAQVYGVPVGEIARILQHA